MERKIILLNNDSRKDLGRTLHEEVKDMEPKDKGSYLGLVATHYFLGGKKY